MLKYRKILIYAAMTAVLCFLFIFAPRPQEEYCGKFIEVGQLGFFPLNCDSWDYIETAESPSKLFDKKSIRQTRPLYVVLAAAAGYGLAPLFRVLPVERFNGQDALLGSSFYWGFMLLNFLILVLSLLVFDRICGLVSDGKFPGFARFLLGVPLVSNVVIKTSVWSAHQQMLTILSPLLSVYFCLRIALAEKLEPKRIYGISLAGGLLMLTYGNFLILFAAVWLTLAFRLLKTGEFSWASIKRLLLPAFVLFTFPTLFWSAVLLIVNGAVYSHEVAAYRQFVWVFDKLAISFAAFREQFAEFSGFFWTSIYRTALVFLIAFALLKIYNFLTRKKEAEETPGRASRQFVYALVFLLYLLFFWFLGYYGERLTFTLVPVVLCAIADELNLLLAAGKRLTVGVVYVLLLTCAAFWIYSNVNTYGPFKDLTKNAPGIERKVLEMKC
ncbi:MAG: hypothetical protein JSS81_29885 [Acidobacteria bacterium]|nr:hypothetical protein [Acidobacteriota bacterium]